MPDLQPPKGLALAYIIRYRGNLSFTRKADGRGLFRVQALFRTHSLHNCWDMRKLHLDDDNDQHHRVAILVCWGGGRAGATEAHNMCLTCLRHCDGHQVQYQLVPSSLNAQVAHRMFSLTSTAATPPYHAIPADGDDTSFRNHELTYTLSACPAFAVLHDEVYECAAALRLKTRQIT